MVLRARAGLVCFSIPTYSHAGGRAAKRPTTIVVACGELLLPSILLSLARFQADYDIGRTKTYQLIHEGALETVKIGRRTYITAISAQKWLDGLARGITAEPRAVRDARSVKQGREAPLTKDGAGAFLPAGECAPENRQIVACHPARRGAGR